jgi:hypothetical protein
MAESDDNFRPQKRTKPESSPYDDRSRAGRDAPPKGRDYASAHDSSAHRDAKPSTSSSSLPNGRSILKSALGSSQDKSPVSRGRGNSINGNRPSSAGSGRNTPSKLDTSSKPAVPPLLSPLHLSFESQDARDAASKAKKRREDGHEQVPTPKPAKLEPPGPPKKQKSPLQIPPLLSPTLPPIIEAELALHKKGLSKNADSNANARLSSESPGNRKKFVDDEKKGRLMVTLKYSKKIAKTVQRLLALPPKKEVNRKERSESTEAPPPLPAKKRPVNAADSTVDAMSTKRPRTSDISSSNRLPAPSTPSKTSTAMSRIDSNNSQAHTPGEANNSLTPSAAASSERPHSTARARALRERWDRYNKLGRKLKHDRDDALKKGKGASGEPDMKFVMATGMESIMAFMISSRALDDARQLERKAQDWNFWQNILPLLDIVKQDTRRSKAMHALAWQLNAVILEQVIRCYSTVDPSQVIQDIVKGERLRSSTWRTAHEAYERVEHHPMRANLGPWSTVDDAVTSALRIMGRWAEEEGLDRRSEVSVPGPVANGA